MWPSSLGSAGWESKQDAKALLKILMHISKALLPALQERIWGDTAPHIPGIPSAGVQGERGEERRKEK